jgi:hypothetical protein
MGRRKDSTEIFCVLSPSFPSSCPLHDSTNQKVAVTYTVKGAVIEWCKDSYFNKQCWEKLDVHILRKKLDSYIILKNESKI